MAKRASLWERNRKLIETYGLIAVFTGLGLFVIEMVVIVALLKAGVDMQPAVDTIAGWFGWDGSGVLEAAGTVGVAYAITRILKPLQLIATALLTPVVARFVPGAHRAVQAAKADPSRPPGRAEPAPVNEEAR